MKKNMIILLFTISSIALFSCGKDDKILIPYPEDITFEDQALGRFKFNIPNAPFKSGNDKTGVATFNVKNNGDGTFSGFAVSNKNWRSFPWTLSPDFPPAGGLTPAKIKSAIDSCIFSVYTTVPNQTNNFLVACVKDQDASFTLDKPSVIEHALVANTTYNYLLESYGSIYSDTKVKNINIENPSTQLYGRFTLPGPGGQNLEELSTGYVKLTIQGFNGATATGSVDFWLAVRPDASPGLDYVLPSWNKVDLTALGVVNKVVFNISSSYKDGAGNMLVPPYFCLDGIRLKK
ncbi:DUF4465 domain-containing protein [Pedobacter nyackensis]|uniref:DUF4465 domain-containing protein n=1 Tax=Pedobacter nyackensis TaxID=475255 RepID=UPI00292FC548|nr:DUF4465 domain-containing protein [Pedobacter nyackensis]